MPKPGPTRKRSAGLLLFRRSSEGLEVLLVHPGGPYWVRRDDGAWSLPKGEIEEGEAPLEVALREFEEELGVPAPVDPGALRSLGSVRQNAGKLVDAWAAEGTIDAETISSSTFRLEWPPHSGRMQEFPEVDRAAWFPLGEARTKLLAAQVEFLDRLLEQMGARPEE